MSGRFERLIAILRRDEGSNIVEMAISSTVLFAMLIGTCQMSIAFYAYNFVSDAARQATRYAMVRGGACHTNTPSLSNCPVTTDEITTYVQSLHFPGIRTANVTVATQWCPVSLDNNNSATWPSSGCSSTASNAAGNMVQVTVGYPLSFTIPWVGTKTLSISAASEMMITQ